MTIAVTGSQGQLGAELCRQLGNEAAGLDLPEFDLTDCRVVCSRLEELRPEAVINTAAYTLVDRAEGDAERCRAVNVDGVRHLAEACRALDVPLVQISTDYVFGQAPAERRPWRETDQPQPQGVYAKSKFEGELAAASWDQHLVVRTCGLYGRLGPNSPGNFVETMLRLGAAGKPLRIVDDQHCTPSYVAHVARAIRFLLGAGARGIYHVVNTGETTWFGFAAEIFRQAGLAVEMTRITTAEYGAPAPRPSFSVLGTYKYQSMPGGPVLPAWQEALAEYLKARTAA